MSQPDLADPFFAFFEEQDETHKETPKIGFESLNRKISSVQLWGLFVGSAKFHSDNQDAVVTSTFGPRGSGKSLGTLFLALTTANIYGVPMSVNDILYDAYVANKEIRSKPFRSTTMVDESLMPIGMQSGTVIAQLEKFEHEGRYTQKNVFWVSIEDKYHPDEFKFEANKTKLERVSNPTCNACPFYSQCKASYFDTLCKKDPAIKAQLGLAEPVDYTKRTGYPILFSFNVYSYNRYLEDTVFRGVMQIPMVDAKTAYAYDSIKRSNVERMQHFQSDKQNFLNQLADQVFNKHKDELFHAVGKNMRPVGKDRLEMFVEMETSEQLSFNARKHVIELLKVKVEAHLRNHI